MDSPRSCRRARTINGLFYATSAYEGSTVGLNFDRSTDLPLVFDQSFSVDPSGSPIGLPDRLKGVSGGPVLWLEHPERPSPDNLRLVGVQSATQRIDSHRHLIKAIRIEGVLVRLLRRYSDLRRVLELHGVGVME